MARTLIGQLILRLRTEGLGEANKITGVVRQVEDAARRLNNTGSWGVGFQNHLNKLKLTAGELREVEKSWVQLHDSMKDRNLASALKSSEIGHWKTNTVSVLAQGRVAMEEHMRLAEKSARSHATRMRDILKPGLVMLGAYSAPYFGGMLGREAFTAASERQRENFRQRMANIPENERGQILSRSEELGQRYPSVPITAIMELARTARNTMGDTERGLQVLEEAVRGLVVLQSSSGPDAAASALDGLLRGIDNLGQNKDGPVGVEQTKQIIDGVIRAAQIEGYQLDPGSLFTFARRSKIAGPALSNEFLVSSAPAIMQDMSPETAGATIASAYQAFVIGSNAVASKANIDAQRRIGIRQGPGKGTLVGAELFGQNPYEWVKQHLIPALQKDGVDINDDGQVSKAVADLTRNTHASGLLARLVQQRDQIEKLVGLYRGAAGTDVADDVRHEDPFVALAAFKKSLQNLSASMMPIEHITVGLNSLADGINKLASAAKDSPIAAWLGAGAAGFGAHKGGKFAFGKLTDLFGLKGSAVALDGSAAALTRAAVALGGSAALDGNPGGPDKKRSWFTPLTIGLAGLTAYVDIMRDQGEKLKADKDRQEQDNAKSAQNIAFLRNLVHAVVPDGTPESVIAGQRAASSGDNPLQNAVDSATRLGGGPVLDTAAIEQAKQTAAFAGQDIQSSLSVTATPNVDTSGIDNAIRKAQHLLQILSSAGAAAKTAQNNVGAEMRRNFSDRGGGL